MVELINALQVASSLLSGIIRSEENELPIDLYLGRFALEHQQTLS
jgi:hypothetical protein